jgi:hypothetical protein
MVEKNQPTKRYKTSNTHTERDISQASPIGYELDSYTPISIADEENKREIDENDQSERERDTFLDTDVRHAWVERVPNHIKWLPHNYPFDIQNLVLVLLDRDAILMPKRLDMSWCEAICISTCGLDIVFKTASELAKFMRHTHEDIPLSIPRGGCRIPLLV